MVFFVAVVVVRIDWYLLKCTKLLIEIKGYLKIHLK